MEANLLVNIDNCHRLGKLIATMHSISTDQQWLKDYTETRMESRLSMADSLFKNTDSESIREGLTKWGNG